MPRRIKLIFYPIAILGRAWSIASALRPIVTDHGGADWAGTVHEVVNGLMRLPQIHTGQLQRLELASDRPLIIHADGEILAGFGSTVTRLTVESVPAAIQVVC